LQKAAEAGSPVASFRLAVDAFSSAKPDLLVGYKYLLAAANGNLGEAQNELGLLYLSGKIASADSPAGIAWLTRAAQGGNASAQNNLATLYERGAGGVTQNIENAGQLYSLAANQGNAAATLALARLVKEGVGTKADPVKAWALATLAQERGEKTAKQMVDEIADKLDEAQKLEAKKQLEEIKSNKKKDAAPAAEKSPATNTPPAKVK
jgi:TPR repeat protein